MVITRYTFEPVIEHGVEVIRYPEEGEYIMDGLDFRKATEEDTRKEYPIFTLEERSFIKALPLKDILRKNEA
jgi:hypothetical protein